MTTTSSFMSSTATGSVSTERSLSACVLLIVPPGDVGCREPGRLAAWSHPWDSLVSPLAAKGRTGTIPSRRPASPLT